MKKFQRKGNEDNRQFRKFKYKTLGASTGNQRNKEENKTILPLHLFA